MVSDDSSRTLAGSREDVLYLPIDTPERQIGVLEVRGRPDGGRFDDEDRALLGSLADQAALALERVRLTQRSRARRSARPIGRAQIGLARLGLARSPYPAGDYQDLGQLADGLRGRLAAWTRAIEFLEAIDEETDRLTRMVGNLLDLSRIEGGALRPDRDWYDARELVQRVVARLRAPGCRHRTNPEPRASTRL